MRKRLIQRLKTRLGELEKLDRKNQYRALRTKVALALSSAEANPKAFDPAMILALITAILEILKLLRKNPAPAA